jgi:hypothetical protein
MAVLLAVALLAGWQQAGFCQLGLSSTSTATPAAAQSPADAAHGQIPSKNTIRLPAPLKHATDARRIFYTTSFGFMAGSSKLLLHRQRALLERINFSGAVICSVKEHPASTTDPSPTAHRLSVMETSGPATPTAPRHRQHRVQHSPTNISDHTGPPPTPHQQDTESRASVERAAPRDLASVATQGCFFGALLGPRTG